MGHGSDQSILLSQGLIIIFSFDIQHENKLRTQLHISKIEIRIEPLFSLRQSRLRLLL